VRTKETSKATFVFAARENDQGGSIDMTVPTFGADAREFLNIHIRYSFIDIPSDPYRVRCTLSTGGAPRGTTEPISMLPTAETIVRITSCLEYCIYVERHVTKYNTHPMSYDEYIRRDSPICNGCGGSLEDVMEDR
jgi:hypothetical protein